MAEIALHTRLRPGCEQEYARVHAVIPPELDGALRAAGVRSWRIWLSGQDLFHLVDVDDYRAMRAAMRDDPANIAWQAIVGPLHEVADDYSGNDDGIGLLWSLPKENV